MINILTIFLCFVNYSKKQYLIFIFIEKIYLKYFYDTIKETIIHTVECFGDTIIKKTIIPYEVEKIVYKELTWWQQYKHIIIIFSLLILVLIVFKKLGRLLL